jgi:hypothetical protein
VVALEAKREQGAGVVIATHLLPQGLNADRVVQLGS